jgi:hypothetical protein
MKEEVDVFCPKCNYKMARDFIARARNNDELPCFWTILFAINILTEAGCPLDLIKQVHSWASKQNVEYKDGLTPEEKERLALIKWNEWATQ